MLRFILPGFHKQDQWEAQIQALVQQKAEVYLYSDRFSEEELAGPLLKPCADIRQTIESFLGKYGIAAHRFVSAPGRLES